MTSSFALFPVAAFRFTRRGWRSRDGPHRRAITPVLFWQQDSHASTYTDSLSLSLSLWCAALYHAVFLFVFMFESAFCKAPVPQNDTRIAISKVHVSYCGDEVVDEGLVDDCC